MEVFLLIGTIAGVGLYLLKCLAWFLCSCIIDVLLGWIPGIKTLTSLMNKHPLCMAVRDMVIGCVGIAMFANTGGSLVTMIATLAYAGCSVSHIGIMFMIREVQRDMENRAFCQR